MRACSPSACTTGEDSVWDLAVVDGERRLPLALDEPRTWRAGDREVALVAGGHGAALSERTPRPVIDAIALGRTAS